MNWKGGKAGGNGFSDFVAGERQEKKSYKEKKNSDIRKKKNRDK